MEDNRFTAVFGRHLLAFGKQLGHTLLYIMDYNTYDDGLDHESNHFLEAIENLRLLFSAVR